MVSLYSLFSSKLRLPPTKRNGPCKEYAFAGNKKIMIRKKARLHNELAPYVPSLMPLT